MMLTIGCIHRLVLDHYYLNINELFAFICNSVGGQFPTAGELNVGCGPTDGSFPVKTIDLGILLN